MIIGVGLIFHTDFDPAIFGKYSGRYFALLCAWWLFAVPISYLFGRFLFGTQTVRLSGGREAHVRPRLKLGILFGIAVPGLFLFSWVVEARLKETTATVHTDEFHPFLQNTPKPHRETYQINKWGFRGGDIEEEKPPGTYRIFMLGGSTAFCGDLPYDATHCGLLEKKLKERFPGRAIEVQNASTDWHTSQHSLIKLLMYVQDFEPDLIVVFHGVNDLMRGLSPDAFAAEMHYWPDYRHYYGPVANYVRPRSAVRSIFNMYFGYWFSDFRNDRVRVIGPDGEGVMGATMLFFPKTEEIRIRKWKSLPSFERNMRDLVAVAQAKGINVILASQPSLYREDLEAKELEVIWFPQSHHDDGERPSIESMARGMRECNEITERIAREAGATFVDLDSMLPRTLEYFYDDVHFTRKSNEIIAEAWLDAIVEANLIPE